MIELRIQILQLRVVFYFVSFVRLLAQVMKRNAFTSVAAVAESSGWIRRRQRGQDDDGKFGRGKPRRAERGRHSSRDVQSDVEENSCYAAFTLNRSAGQLRSSVERIFLR